MKMVKGLLLGTATALVAMSGAQAADLPVKAKPVQYVKICSLYGLGYFYIPGTDTCIKLGGALRAQYEYNAGSGGIPHGFGSSSATFAAGNAAVQGRFNVAETNDVNFRTRIYFSFDARQQTEYGTLRTYARFGVQQTTPTDTAAGAVFWDRAMIQFAGFTIGHAVSYFDMITFADFNYNNPRTFSDTGPAGLNMVAYTWQFGNGVSATISFDDPLGHNGKGVYNTSTAFIAPAGATLAALGPAANNGITGQAAALNGSRMPDIVANLRVDQAWGLAGISAALHDINGGYQTTVNGTGVCSAGVNGSGSAGCGRPDSEWGGAVRATLLLNLPGWGATGIANSQPNVDQFKIDVAYGSGATGYVMNGTGVSTLFGDNGSGGGSLAYGFASDALFSNGGGINRTNAWSVNAGFQHLWTPTLRTSIYGGYAEVNYNGTATTQFCASGALAGAFGAAAGGAGCNPDFQIWQIGSRTQWNPVSQLDLGIDVLYSELQSMSFGNGNLVTTQAGSQPAGLRTVGDQGVVSILARAQRNFWP